MADAVKNETFVSSATIYKSGGGHPYPPGTPVDLHPDHAAEFRKVGLEKKADAPVISKDKVPAKAD